MNLPFMLSEAVFLSLEMTDDIKFSNSKLSFLSANLLDKEFSDIPFKLVFIMSNVPDVSKLFF
jgi:hypothetical protein